MELSSWLRKQLEEASPDLLRAMVQDFAEARRRTSLVAEAAASVVLDHAPLRRTEHSERQRLSST
jgi:hypothetical protein